MSQYKEEVLVKEVDFCYNYLCKAVGDLVEARTCFMNVLKWIDENPDKDFSDYTLSRWEDCRDVLQQLIDYAKYEKKRWRISAKNDGSR